MGGTSLSAPTWAGLIAIANQGRVASGSSTLDGRSELLLAIYAVSQTDFHDITSAGNGGSKAGVGHDTLTGIGSPKANLLVPDLAEYGSVGRLAVLRSHLVAPERATRLVFRSLVENSAGSLEQDFDGSVTVSLGNDPAGGILGGTLTVTAQNGVALFSGLTLTIRRRWLHACGNRRGHGRDDEQLQHHAGNSRETGGDLRANVSRRRSS